MGKHQEKNIAKRIGALEEKLAEKNRELEIEAALERVRARTMAMRFSTELNEVIKEVTDQLQLLGFNFDTSNLGSQYIQTGFYLWNSVPGQPVLSGVYVPKKKLKLIDWLYGEKRALNKVKPILINKRDTSIFFKYYLSLEDARQIPQDRKKFLMAVPSISLLTAFRKDFTLSVLNYRGVKYSDDDGVILDRFANVFEQSYTRFLDLQKAEKQTREAEIELALERVRARTMAMQKSDELKETTLVLFRQFKSLGATTAQVSICVFDEDTKKEIGRASCRERV